MPRRPAAFALLLLAATGLAACGGSGGGSVASFTVPGTRPPATGPPITLARAQSAIESRRVDMFFKTAAQNAGAFRPQPVESELYTTADSGWFFLYVFVDARTAHAALPSARSIDAAENGHVVQAGNVIVTIPANGDSGMAQTVPRTLQQLARRARTNPSKSGTPLQPAPPSTGQPQGPPT